MNLKMRMVGGAVAVVALGGCALDQPEPRCVVGRGVHAVRYTLVSGTGSCAQKGAEEVGVQKYNPPETAPVQTVALQPDTLWLLNQSLQGSQTANPSFSPISLGTLRGDQPDEEGYCHVDGVSEGRQQSTAEPGVDVRYAWSDVRFYAGAEAPGTQWSATVQYTEGSCSATYKAVGVFPIVYCAVNRDRITDRPIRNPDGTLTVDPELCKKPNPLTLLALDGSFDVRCDEGSGLCVLNSDAIPALKK